MGPSPAADPSTGALGECILQIRILVDCREFKMIKKIIFGLLALVAIALAFVWFRTRPSGDIGKYKEYYVDDQVVNDSSVRVTFFGVSTLLIDDGQTQILIDGFLSRPSMTTTLLGDIQSDSTAINRILRDFRINRLRGIFVTHSHYDHAFDAGYVAWRTGATLYGSPSTLNIGRGAGVPESQLQAYQPNVDLSLGNFRVRVVPSIHSPGSALNDEGLSIDKPLLQPASFKAYLEGGSFDFLITHGGKKIYIKPSPNFNAGALDSLDVDALFLGIATVTKHDPTWASDFYRENVTATEPALMVPIHWDDFFYPVSDQLVMLPKFTASVEKDFDYFIEKTRKDKIDFKVLQGTRTIVLF